MQQILVEESASNEASSEANIDQNSTKFPVSIVHGRDVTPGVDKEAAEDKSEEVLWLPQKVHCPRE